MEPFEVVFHGIVNDQLQLTVNGQQVEYSLTQVAPELLAAPSDIQQQYEISPNGYGIRWPALDLDLAIPPILNAQKQTFAA